MPRIDPRLKEVVETTNGVITERAIRHALFMERFKTQQVNEIVGFLNMYVIPDLLNKLEPRLKRIGRRLPLSPIQRQRLRYLIRSSRDVLQAGLKRAGEKFMGSMKELAEYESEFQQSIIKKALPFEIDLVTPNVQVLHSVVTTSPMRGEMMGKWFNSIGKKAQTTIKREINIGLVQGESVPKMVKRIRGVAGLVRREAEAVVRTSVSHTVNNARMATFEANKDVVTKWKYLATLDTRTTEICMGLDGKQFNVGEGPFPPQHWNCRSQEVPVVISVQEIADMYNIKGPDGKPAKFAKATGRRRAALGGPVKREMTYGEWLKKQSVELQNEALGVGRARLYRRGKVKIDRFVKDGKRLTLKQLQELEQRLS